MAKNNNLTDFLIDIADALRTNDGTTAKINPQNFRTKIANTVGVNIPKRSSTDLVVAGSTIKASAGYYAGEASKSIPNGAITSGTTNHSEYVQNTTVVPANGYLYIGAGYYPNTQISLASLIPDDANLVNAGNAQIRKNYEAYSPSGAKLVGTIEDCTPSNTYYTDTNTGYGVIAGYSYINTATKYIKAGSASTPATTIKTYGTLSTTYTANKGYQLSIQSKTQNVTPSVSAGWVASGNAGTVTVQDQDEPRYIPQSTWSSIISNNSATTLNFGTKYKLSSGYYPSDRYYYVPLSEITGYTLNTWDETDYRVILEEDFNIEDEIIYDSDRLEYMIEYGVSHQDIYLPEIDVNITLRFPFFDESPRFIDMEYSVSSSAYGSIATTVTPSTSAQYINLQQGYNSTNKYIKVNAITASTLPTTVSTSASGTNKAYISQTTGTRYLNIPAGYVDKNYYYTLPALTTLVLPTTTLTSAPSQDSDYYIATINAKPNSGQYLKIPAGYNSEECAYTIGMGLPYSSSSFSMTISSGSSNYIFCKVASGSGYVMCDSANYSSTSSTYNKKTAISTSATQICRMYATTSTSSGTPIFIWTFHKVTSGTTVSIGRNSSSSAPTSYSTFTAPSSDFIAIAMATTTSTSLSVKVFNLK